MKGPGISGSRARRAWRAVRRVGVATAVAILVAGVGSRVNRAVPAEPGLTAGPGVADERLGEVRMDAASLGVLVADVNAAAGRERVRLDPGRLKVEDMVVRPGVGLPGRWRDVRIGDVLAAGTRDAFRDEAIDWREQDGVIVVGRPGPLECRVYDVRDLAEDARAWVESLAAAPRAQALPAVCFMSQRVDGPPPTVDEEVAALVRETVQWGMWDDAAGPWFCRAWGGRLVVVTSARGHRYVETLLTMLRHTGSGAAATKGGGR